MSKRQRHALKKQKRASIQTSLTSIANRLMKYQRELLPLILREKMDPGASAILIAIYTEGRMAGATDKYTMTIDQTMDALKTLLMLWSTGMFVPTSDYPHTLQETLTCLKERDEVENE